MLKTTVHTGEGYTPTDTHVLKTQMRFGFTLTLGDLGSGRGESLEGGGDWDTPGSGGVERGEVGEDLGETGCAGGRGCWEGGDERRSGAPWVTTAW